MTDSPEARGRAEEDSAHYETVPCNLCGADDFTVRFAATPALGRDAPSWSAFRCTASDYGVHPTIVECRRCGLVYTNPRLNGAEIERRYSEVEDQLYLRERLGREWTFRRHLIALEDHTGLGAGDRLLDVGAYVGVFVEEAEKRGWNATGVEPSKWAVEVARERGLDVIPGRLEDRQLPPGELDAVTLWDVIEHLPDPRENLEIVFSLLRPGGWLAVHTMDIESPFARLAGRRWPWLMEMHLYYFGRRTLTSMLEAAGFVDISVRAKGRYVRMAYLVTRLRRIGPGWEAVFTRALRLFRLDRLLVPFHLGDLVTAYARRP